MIPTSWPSTSFPIPTIKVISSTTMKCWLRQLVEWIFSRWSTKNFVPICLNAIVSNFSTMTVLASTSASTKTLALLILLSPWSWSWCPRLGHGPLWGRTDVLRDPAPHDSLESNRRKSDSNRCTCLVDKIIFSLSRQVFWSITLFSLFLLTRNLFEVCHHLQSFPSSLSSCFFLEHQQSQQQESEPATLPSSVGERVSSLLLASFWSLRLVE